LALNNCAGLTNLTCHYTNNGYWYWETTPFPPETACADGYDNDCDGLIDGADPDCAGVLICNINVPDTGLINQWIEINVSGSQGAIAAVRFASNLIGEPIGSWTDWYDWNVSSGDWNASSQTMKWSFVDLGNYEVWAEVSDGTETASCYDTITIFECYPGQTRTCISDYGCEHTQTCTSGGTWPTTICGSTDECTPGGEPQTCWVDGTEGLQTCTDICTWGPCVTPPPDGDGCPWPPPECPICGHPECLTPPVWTCEPEPAGTDCSDCKECDGVGVGEDYCIYQCWEGPQDKCECISDVCIDCSDYYDGDCGYQGICHCGPLEIPIWSCIDGNCSCSCQFDLSCEELGDECQRDYPDVVLSPLSQPGKAGDTLTYDVSVINRDLNCDPSILSLSAGEYCNQPGWTCSLDLNSLTIDSGYSDSTTLRVTSPPDTSKGDKNISVTAQNTDFPEFFGTGYAIYEVFNNPPSATNLSATPIGDCFLSHPYVELEWSFSDPDLASGDYQSAYQVEIFSDSGYTNLVNRSCDECPPVAPDARCIGVFPIYDQVYRYTPYCGLSFNTTYYWRVRVWDNEDAPSDCGQPEGWCYPEEPFFHTEKEWPWPKFSVTPPTQRVHLKERVEFTDESTCYDGSCPTANYSWEFGDGETSSEQGNTSHVYLTRGNYDVTLTITDEMGSCTPDPITITVTRPLPEWMEIPPF
jgi:hypothetical protein